MGNLSLPCDSKMNFNVKIVHLVVRTIEGLNPYELIPNESKWVWLI